MPPDGHCSRHACQKSYDLYLTEIRSLLNSMLNCYTLDIFLFSLSCNSEVSFFHSSETFIIFCKYYASPRTSEQPMNPVNNEQWTVNNNQWTMTPAENMYISMKCSVCTISYTVINIDKKKACLPIYIQFFLEAFMPTYKSVRGSKPEQTKIIP